MALKKFNPITSSQRGLILVDRSELWKGRPVKKLTEGLTSKGGRNNAGRITARRRGGGHKRLYRKIDFKRRKFDVPATVERIEYDPNRSAFIALLKYEDGEQSYIVAPQRLAVGDVVVAGSRWTSSRAMRCDGEHPGGTIIHNVGAPRQGRPDRAGGGHLCPACRQGFGLCPAPPHIRRGADGAGALHGDHRRGLQFRQSEHQEGQGRAEPMAGQTAFRARRRDEPGRPSAWRRRGAELGRPPPGDALGRADQGQAERGKKKSDALIMRRRHKR